MGVGGQRYAPDALLSGKRPCTYCTEAGWAPGLVWTEWKIFPPPGFDLRTVHPVASLYTDYAIPA